MKLQDASLVSSLGRDRSTGIRKCEAVEGNDAQHQTQAKRAAPGAILAALASFMDPVAAFYVLWPHNFEFLTERPVENAVTVEEVFATPRQQLVSAFYLDTLETFVARSGTVPLMPWRVERLPTSLQRPPFLVPGVTKLTLPFCVRGECIGFAGLSLPCKLGDSEHAWYVGCCTALTMSIVAGAPDGFVAEENKAAIQAHPTMVPANAPTQGALKRLSSRELEIAKYLAEGHSTINVGAILGVSENTVRTHVRRIYGKLKVCSRLELAARMRE